jgi:hypothetical protein
LEVDAPAAAASAHPLAGLLDRGPHPAVGDQPDSGGRPGHGGPAQHRTHLVAEAAARDQRESLDPLGELVEELHRDPAAEGVADDRRPVDPDGRQEVPDAAGMGTERVVPPHRCRVAVAQQVGGDDRVAVGQPQRHPLPVLGGVDHPVDEDDRRAVSRDPVDHAVPVKLDLPLVEDQSRRRTPW